MAAKKIIFDQVSDDAIKKFITDYRNPFDQNYKYLDRYSSFDYCYNYFQSFHIDGKIKAIASNENIEMSVLQLAFYLASWGMYRGGTALLRHSSHSLIPVVKLISDIDPKYWAIDIFIDKEKIDDPKNEK